MYTVSLLCCASVYLYAFVYVSPSFATWKHNTHYIKHIDRRRTRTCYILSWLFEKYATSSKLSVYFTLLFFYSTQYVAFKLVAHFFPHRHQLGASLNFGNKSGVQRNQNGFVKVYIDCWINSLTFDEHLPFDQYFCLIPTEQIEHFRFPTLLLLTTSHSFSIFVAIYFSRLHTPLCLYEWMNEWMYWRNVANRRNDAWNFEIEGTRRHIKITTKYHQKRWANDRKRVAKPVPSSGICALRAFIWFDRMEHKHATCLFTRFDFVWRQTI